METQHFTVWLFLFFFPPSVMHPKRWRGLGEDHNCFAICQGFFPVNLRPYWHFGQKWCLSHSLGSQGCAPRQCFWLSSSVVSQAFPRVLALGDQALFGESCWFQQSLSQSLISTGQDEGALPSCFPLTPVSAQEFALAFLLSYVFSISHSKKNFFLTGNYL